MPRSPNKRGRRPIPAAKRLDKRMVTYVDKATYTRAKARWEAKEISETEYLRKLVEDDANADRSNLIHDMEP